MHHSSCSKRSFRIRASLAVVWFTAVGCDHGAVSESTVADSSQASVLRLYDRRPDLQKSDGAPAPCASENAAEVILIATICEPDKGRSCSAELRLDVEEVLKGRSLLTTGEVHAHDAPDWKRYACLEIPPDAEHFSDRYPGGCRIGIYLSRDADRQWCVIDMTDVPEREAEWKKNILRFAAVAAAAKSSDAKAQYAALLTETALDEYTFYALAYNPHPAATPHIRRWLIDYGNLSVAERKTVVPGYDWLVQLLGIHHDAAAVLPALRVAETLKVGERSAFFEFLPRLCRDADTETLGHVRDALQAMLRTLPVGDGPISTAGPVVVTEFHTLEQALKRINEQLQQE